MMDAFTDADGHQLRERAIECSTDGCRAMTVRARGLCDACAAHEDEVGARWGNEFEAFCRRNDE